MQKDFFDSIGQSRKSQAPLRSERSVGSTQFICHGVAIALA
jgi:hypothetical protein